MANNPNIDLIRDSVQLGQYFQSLDRDCHQLELALNDLFEARYSHRLSLTRVLEILAYLTQAIIQLYLVPQIFVLQKRETDIFAAFVFMGAVFDLLLVFSDFLCIAFFKYTDTIINLKTFIIDKAFLAFNGFCLGVKQALIAENIPVLELLKQLLADCLKWKNLQVLKQMKIACLNFITFARPELGKLKEGFNNIHSTEFLQILVLSIFKGVPTSFDLLVQVTIKAVKETTVAHFFKQSFFVIGPLYFYWKINYVIDNLSMYSAGVRMPQEEHDQELKEFLRIKENNANIDNISFRVDEAIQKSLKEFFSAEGLCEDNSSCLCFRVKQLVYAMQSKNHHKAQVMFLQRVEGFKLYLEKLLRSSATMFEAGSLPKNLLEDIHNLLKQAITDFGQSKGQDPSHCLTNDLDFKYFAWQNIQMLAHMNEEAKYEAQKKSLQSQDPQNVYALDWSQYYEEYEWARDALQNGCLKREKLSEMPKIASTIETQNCLKNDGYAITQECVRILNDHYGLLKCLLMRSHESFYQYMGLGLVTGEGGDKSNNKQKSVVEVLSKLEKNAQEVFNRVVEEEILLKSLIRSKLIIIERLSDLESQLNVEVQV